MQLIHFTKVSKHKEILYNERKQRAENFFKALKQGKNVMVIRGMDKRSCKNA